MKVVYLCAPYRAPTTWGVHQNIQAAARLAAEIWELGAICLCPHLNTAYFDGIVSDQVFLDGAIELLKRSDAMFIDRSRPMTSGMVGEWNSFTAEKRELAFSMMGALHIWITDQAKELTK